MEILTADSLIIKLLIGRYQAMELFRMEGLGTRISEIIQNDAVTAKAHSGVSKKRPDTMASPGSASKRAKLMSPRESNQLKDK